jgi:hypothetical protein
MIVVGRWCSAGKLTSASHLHLCRHGALLSKACRPWFFHSQSLDEAPVLCLHLPELREFSFEPEYLNSGSRARTTTPLLSTEKTPSSL